MKNRYFKILLLAGLLLAFGTVSFAQKKKRTPRAMIVSEDFKTPAPSGVGRKKRAKKVKKWRKRCRYQYFKRKGRITRVYRCRKVSY